MQYYNAIIIVTVFAIACALSKILVKKTNFITEKDLHYKTLFSCFLAIIAGLFSTALVFQAIDKDMLHSFIIEDHFLEWFGFFVLFTGFVFTGYYFIQIAKQEKKPFPLKGLTLFCLSAAFLFGAMEEISWGQRVFDVESGEFFKANNAQAETNFHNMVVGGVKLNKLIFGKFMFVFLLIHNIFWPLAIRKWEKAKALHDKIGNFVPPWPQVIVFVIAALLVKLVDHSRHNELNEVTGSLHYLVSVIAVFGLGYGQIKKPISEDKAKKTICIFTSIMGSVLLGLLIIFYIA